MESQETTENEIIARTAFKAALNLVGESPGFIRYALQVPQRTRTFLTLSKSYFKVLSHTDSNNESLAMAVELAAFIMVLKSETNLREFFDEYQLSAWHQHVQHYKLGTYFENFIHKVSNTSPALPANEKHAQCMQTILEITDITHKLATEAFQLEGEHVSWIYALDGKSLTYVSGVFRFVKSE